MHFLRILEAGGVATNVSVCVISTKTQSFLLQFGTNSPGGMPLFYPVN